MLVQIPLEQVFWTLLVSMLHGFTVGVFRSSSNEVIWKRLVEDIDELKAAKSSISKALLCDSHPVILLIAG